MPSSSGGRDGGQTQLGRQVRRQLRREGALPVGQPGRLEFIETPLDVREGQLHMPDAPGLGIEMNMDFLRANADEEFRGN